MEKKSTIFCDIDGTIFKYREFENYKKEKCQVLPGVLNKLNKWREDGHMIILTTARPENLREDTLEELSISNVPYDRLIMGIERGVRVLINDKDPKLKQPKAIAINLKRDEGMIFDKIEIDLKANSL